MMTGTGSPLIALSRAILSRTPQSGTVDRKQARGSSDPGLCAMGLCAADCPFIIRNPCTILVIVVLRRQGWKRACKDNDTLRCKLTTSVHVYMVYDIVYDIVRLTYDVVSQNTGSCHFDVQCRIQCRIRCHTFFVRHRMYNVRNRKKRTISYVLYRFLPF